MRLRVIQWGLTMSKLHNGVAEMLPLNFFKLVCAKIPHSAAFDVRIQLFLLSHMQTGDGGMAQR